MRKQYGQSRVDTCPFCSQRGLIKNPQGIPVCQQHKNRILEGMRCLCGEALDLLEGKWGPYFICPNCGNMSFRKGMEMNPRATEQSAPKEITVRSDELEFL